MKDVRKEAFQAVVDSNLFSGLPSRVLTKSEELLLDKNRTALLRKTMHGDACEKRELDDGQLKYKSMTMAHLPMVGTT